MVGFGEANLVTGGAIGDWLPANTGREPAPADALEAAAEDTLWAVLAGEVRDGGAGHSGGVEGRVHRNRDGANLL